MQAIVFFVVLILLFLLALAAQAMLSTRIANIFFRVDRLERKHGELSHSLVAVHGWAEREFGAVRSEFVGAQVSAADLTPTPTLTPSPTPSPSPTLKEDPEDQRDTLTTPAPKPGDEDGDETTFFAASPPVYARRSGLIRPPAPLAHADLIGSEDIADEAAYPRLGPDEKTPPRHGRVAKLATATQAQDPKEGGGL